MFGGVDGPISNTRRLLSCRAGCKIACSVSSAQGLKIQSWFVVLLLPYAERVSVMLNSIYFRKFGGFAVMLARSGCRIGRMEGICCRRGMSFLPHDAAYTCRSGTHCEGRVGRAEDSSHQLGSLTRGSAVTAWHSQPWSQAQPPHCRCLRPSQHHHPNTSP